MEPAGGLVAYIGMLALYSFFYLWLLNRDDFPFKPLIAALAALNTLIVLLKHHVQDIDYQLSWLLVGIAVALFILMMYQRPTYVRKWHVWTVVGLFGLGTALLFWYDHWFNIRGATVTVV